MQEITLNEILDLGQVWTGQATRNQAGRPSGFTELDACLAQGGWPAQGLTELTTPHWGVGELQLLLPSLAQSASRLLLWLNPPFQPTAQALKTAGLDLSRCLYLNTPKTEDALWALERSLASGCVDQALFWPSRPPRVTALKRLQQAAQQGGALAHLLHSTPETSLGASTHVRIALHPESPTHSRVCVTRQRGGPASPELHLSLRSQAGYQPRAPKPANFVPPASSQHLFQGWQHSQQQLAL